MRLSKLRIQNFRSIKDETIIFDNYTCLVGANGSGKSVVLMALNVFFQNNDSTITDVSKLSIEDFHHKKIDHPIIITLTFTDLPDINDPCTSDQIKDMLELYARHNELVVFAKAEWDQNNQNAPVKQYGSRLVMNDFSSYFAAEENKSKVGELQLVYAAIREKYPDLPNVKTGKDMRATLRKYEEDHTELCTYKDAEAQFYGFTGGRYILNELIQWVYVPAVKDASTEQEESNKTALGQLLQRTIRKKIDFNKYLGQIEKDAIDKYEEMLRTEEKALTDLQVGIETQLRLWTNPKARLNLQWSRDRSKSIQITGPKAKALIGDDAFIGEIARLGHGMQRGFLVAILSELARNDGGGGPKLLLGFEEPELYQHPPQAQHMASVLGKLASEKNEAQIIITTHSPYFVTSGEFECVRLFRKTNNPIPITRVSYTTYKNVNDRIEKYWGEKAKTPTKLMATISQILQASQKELFFSPFIILVEGLEDVALLSTYFHIVDKWDEFRRYGCHFVIADGKPNINRFLAITQEFEIPTITIFDSDIVSNLERLRRAEKDGNTDKVKGMKAEIARNEKINQCLLKMCNYDEPMNGDVIIQKNLAVWPDNFLASIIEEYGNDIWGDAHKRIIDEYGYQGVSGKNGMVLSGILNEICKTKRSAILTKLCENILEYAESSQ